MKKTENDMIRKIKDYFLHIRLDLCLLIRNSRLRKAIKQANALHHLDRCHYLVIEQQCDRYTSTFAILSEEEIRRRQASGHFRRDIPLSAFIRFSAYHTRQAKTQQSRHPFPGVLPDKQAPGTQHPRPKPSGLSPDTLISLLAILLGLLLFILIKLLRLLPS